MEKSLLPSLVLKRMLLFAMMFVQFSFVPNEGITVYEAVDDYKNVVFVLTLHANKTFAFQENFLDGSVWKDAGTWTHQADVIQMKSSGKSKREHTYLKFDKAVKFNGDEFKIAGDTLLYEGKGNHKLNGHYRKLLILKRKTKHEAEMIEIR